MKKLLLALVSLILVCGLAFAATNSQKIYSVDSDVYKDISKIYVLTGHALPSTAGPWSGDELCKMIEAIDRNDVPDIVGVEIEIKVHCAVEVQCTTLEINVSLCSKSLEDCIVGCLHIVRDIVSVNGLDHLAELVAAPRTCC